MSGPSDIKLVSPDPESAKRFIDRLAAVKRSKSPEAKKLWAETRMLRRMLNRTQSDSERRLIRQQIDRLEKELLDISLHEAAR